MAANMMEMLRQMQLDQKESIKYLHDKFNFVERKIIELDEKIDQQQVPIKRLEEQLRKNNMLLFGNDETEINIEDSGTMLHSDNDKNLMERSTKNIDLNQPENASKTKVEDTKLYSNENLKAKEFDAERKAAIENTAGISLRKQDIDVFSVKLVADHINQLDEKLNRIMDMYQSDMREMKEIIKSFEAVTACFSQDQSNHFNFVLLKLTEINQKELSGMKEFMKNYAERIKQETITELKQITETKRSEMLEIKEVIKNLKMPVPVNAACQNKTVKISPTYFSSDQISKLNSELKQVAETYQGTNTFPVIEVKAGPAEHPFIKHLRKGVHYKGRKGNNEGTIKLGTVGLTTSDVMDLIIEYPNLTFYEVIREWLRSKNEWEATSKDYDMASPKIYNKNGKLVPLRI